METWQIQLEAQCLYDAWTDLLNRHQLEEAIKTEKRLTVFINRHYAVLHDWTPLAIPAC